MSHYFHSDVLPENQLKLFERLSNESFINDFSSFNKIRLAGLKDIAAMKLEAVAGRGSKKDFIDLFFLLKRFTINEIFEFHIIKYGPGLSNRYHLLKSLVYFTDADQEAMPVMINQINWDDVKSRITSLVRQFGTGLLPSVAEGLP